MATAALQVIGFFLGLLGMIGNLVSTILPYWETSAHIGTNIVTAVANMKGLWMECAYQSTGAFQCETYNTILGLRGDLQAARVLMVISIILSAMACAVSSVGMQCTICLEGTSSKTKVAGAGGILFLTAGLLSLIPVSWKTHEVVQAFYQFNMPDGLKYELGECLYLGLASSLLSMLGGGLLTMSCCDNLEVHRGFGSHGSGYPYPVRMGTGGMTRGDSVPYRAATVQTGIHLNPTHKAQNQASQISNSSHSTTAAHASKKKTNPNTASYSVTGYV